MAPEILSAITHGVALCITAAFGAVAYRINSFVTVATDAAQAARVNAAVQATAQEVVSEQGADPTKPRAAIIAAKLETIKPGTQAALTALNIDSDTLAKRIDGAATGLAATAAPVV